MKKYHVFILLCISLFTHVQNRVAGVEKDDKDGSDVFYITKALLRSDSTQSVERDAFEVLAVTSDIQVNSNGDITLVDNGVQIGIDDSLFYFSEEELRILLSTIYNHAGK